MIDQLLQKLEATLQRDSYDEPSVVYLLVEARKLIERRVQEIQQEGDEAKLTELEIKQKVDAYLQMRGPFKLFSNWAVHTELSGQNSTLKKFADAFNHSFDELQKTKQWPSTPFQDFSLFREEMRKFLTDEKLTLKLVDVDGVWDDFVASYVEVVKDCDVRLEFRNGPIKAVVLTTKGIQSINTPTLKLHPLNWWIISDVRKPFCEPIYLQRPIP